MNVSIFSQTDYENIANWTLGQSKPNSNPIKPNSRKAKMNVNAFLQKDYENETTLRPKKTNPNKANFRKAKMNLKSLAGKSGHNLMLGVLSFFRRTWSKKLLI